jgi:hypothetical protein
VARLFSAETHLRSLFSFSLRFIKDSRVEVILRELMRKIGWRCLMRERREAAGTEHFARPVATIENRSRFFERQGYIAQMA